MLLYHGTSGASVPKILEQGIRSRRHTKKNNWEDNPSHSNAIYLTECYAGYFAHCATKRSSLLGILEIDTDKLHEGFLRPDEDFLEQAFREGGSAVDKKLQAALKGLDMAGRTKWFRDHLDEFSHGWSVSVAHLGNCCYMGRIPPEAITRAVTFDWKKNKDIGIALVDPTVTLMNHKFCSQKYRAMTAWLFGDAVSIVDVLAPMPRLEALDKEMRKVFEARIAVWKKTLADRSGITVLK